MALYVLAGPLLNYLSRAAAEPSWSPTADAYFPGSNAYDGRANVPAYWSSSTSDCTVTVDLGLVVDPGFETSTTGWTLGSTAVTFTATSAYFAAGSKSGELTVGTAYMDISVRPGETLSASIKVYAASTEATAHARIENRQSGQFLAATSTWGDQVNFVSSTGTGTWSTGSATLTVEPLSTLLTDPATLRITLETSGSTDQFGYYDDIELFPRLNWCSIHGHNFGPAVTPYLEYYNGLTWTTQSTMTMQRDSFYSVLSSGILARYWRLRLDGTPGSAPYMGEIIMGEATELTAKPQYGGQLEETESQVRLTTADGGTWIYSRGAGPLRKLSFQFLYAAEAEYVQARDVFWRGARGGSNPCVVAATEMDSDFVIFGRVSERTTYTKTSYTIRTGSWDVTELPLPNVTYTP